MKLEKRNERLEGALAGVRKRAAESKEDFLRKGANGGTSFLVGWAEKTGKLQGMWTIPGVPRIVTLSLAANAIAFFAPKGKFKTIMDGAGEGTMSIASYKFGKGEDIAGVDEVDVGGPRARARRTSAAIADQNARLRELEERLRQETAAPDYSEYANYIDIPSPLAA